jgi:arabinan endo-1,5-alpha-L-arabinosidase
VLTPVGSNYELVSVNSGKCLAISGSSTANGAAAVQWTCNASAGQLWTKAATIGGYVTFTKVNSGQCLDGPAPAPRTSNGSSCRHLRPPTRGQTGVTT